MKEFVLDSLSAKQLGRTYISDGILCLVMSGTGCEFMFKGKKLTLTIGCDSCSFTDGKECNFPRVAVLVNGKFIMKKVISSRLEEITIIDSSEQINAEIRIIKLSEAAFSIAEIHPAITDDCGEITPTEIKSLSIEFIGDSITCGYGVDDTNVNSPFSTCAENFMKAYSFRTAVLLDADYSAFSASGYGIISGYTPDGVRNTLELIPPHYETLGFSYSSLPDGRKPHDVSWDFSRFAPDITVINLGTNDSSFCSANSGTETEFEASYIEFLRTVRRCSPGSHIICALGIMDAMLNPFVESACEKYSAETGDENICTFRFDTQDGSLGYSCNYHPSEDTHCYAAEKLAAFIKTKFH